MNDIYGIDPTSPSDFRDFAHLMRLFEIDQGRFIANYPNGGWLPAMREHLRRMPDMEQMKAKELWLSIGRSAMVPMPGNFNHEWSWAENASTTIRDKVFKLIGPKACPPTLEAIDQALLNPEAFPDASGGHIQRSATAYAKAARPLLQTSPKIVLVDPYFKLRYFDDRTETFRPSIRHRKSLEELFREAVKWRRVEIFCLAVSEKEALRSDESGEIFCNELKVLAASCNAASIDLELDVLDPLSSTERHPRYLLGMERGLHFDWGFDTGPQETTSHIEWISKNALQPLLKRFT